MSSFDILTFLECYQQYPCLWDKSISEYKDRNKRDQAEEAFLNIFKLENVLRVKIRSIRGTYNNEFRKVKKSMTTGSSDDEIYKPKLHWYNFAHGFLSKNQEFEPDNSMSQHKCWYV
ncbi:unnamed protein product [Psylliodes chrysocephalus]|uniref:MADF domain-containing protein n=1 Tax=Psylliodes chrysocephalus TaxID=3402493 RepID=A0A9P0CJ82_9CUCU|nr:unnamed protein product [Psylliodes chrysocephala]